MRLFIAEKPSLAREIAAGLGVSKSNAGYIDCKDGSVVTWLFGHFMELAEPDVYTSSDVPVSERTGKKRWRTEDLPIFPDQWRYVLKKEASAQMKVVKELAGRADEIVNGGDAGREGQLLVDEVLDYVKWKGKTSRIWINSVSAEGIRKALADLRDNRDYLNLRRAAEARSHADWLVGMNLTRAWSVKNGQLISIGRVQTPTMSIVVARDLLIENFKPVDHFTPFTVFKHQNGTFKASLVLEKEMDGLDLEGRFVDGSLAKRIIESTTGKQGTIKSYAVTPKQTPPPLGFSLAELQTECSRRFGMKVQATLDAAQALYEEYKMTSYPRTSSRYLTEEQFPEAPSLIKELAKTHPAWANGADTKIHSKIWNSAEAPEHSAIIPTGEGDYSKLPANLKRIYDIIVQRYLMQFYPNYQYNTISAMVSCNSYDWSAKANVMTSVGWKALTGSDSEDEADLDDTGSMPKMERGDSVVAGNGDVNPKKTTPPSHFTEGTLVSAMINVHTLIDDKEAQKKLKETSGIGEEATRASIIETIINRKYVENKKIKGKDYLVSTELGRSLYRALDEALRSPITTANWEGKLLAISKGLMDIKTYETEIKDFVRNQIPRTTGLAGIKQREQLPQAPCTVSGCDGTLTRYTSKNNKDIHFWGCTSKDHDLVADENGKPGQLIVRKKSEGEGPACPKCKKSTGTFKTSTDKPYYKCENCKVSWWPDKDDASLLGPEWSFGAPKKGKKK